MMFNATFNNILTLKLFFYFFYLFFFNLQNYDIFKYIT